MNIIKILKTIKSSIDYRLNNKLHRLNQDKPAYIRWDGYREWFRDDYYWRENGAAQIYPDDRSYHFFKDGIRQ